MATVLFLVGIGVLGEHLRHADIEHKDRPRDIIKNTVNHKNQNV